ncbi:MAG: NYN domain-containing protein [Anaerolineaceae bacterium]|nr:NYN domain-containing protein [Anaerolineaceae bacterium]
MYDSVKQINSQRLAILIDGDNAQPSLIEKMLSEASKYGTVTIRRTYGDWTTSNMGGWKDTLQTHAIQPIQQFRYTIGKNATDSAMIIDAMDLLYSGTVDAFCLVSSDSDYTRLATRIREKGFFVMGIGQKKTPRAFVSACDVFVYTENLVPQKPPKKQVSRRKDSKESAEPKEPPPPDAASLLIQAFENAVQEDGWAFLGTLGHHLRQLDPGFDARTYGHNQLSALIRAKSKLFEVKDVKGEDGNAAIYVKLKEH